MKLFYILIAIFALFGLAMARNVNSCNKVNCAAVSCLRKYPEDCYKQNQAFQPADGECFCCDSCVGKGKKNLILLSLQLQLECKVV